MYRDHFDIKLRLTEINRKSVQLSVTSAVLANLAAQLTELRKVNETVGICADRHTYFNRRKSGDFAQAPGTS